ncbi:MULTISPECIES: beta-N-acetylhexosaminidase [unclassified Neptuniibacter]|uniref:beta-N-acetylhexosaminidase n=1 Tax=unclassified Neptuniibacter TaxID=2630693 RepID=UPI000C36BD79|nr:MULTISPECIES: beta-N-acetylhexosaminidase [unclassified Neptuniibacter]MAY40821.1 beta-N-acetylhexosaminidase [Oceanospirillaceae bacterium]|tara:strand:+ start:17733 stop:18737 length:1005 start_codon:yes stop_codon:yes gene_type:complete
MTEATLFLDLDGVELTPDEVELLQHPLIGGVILFGRNTQSALQVEQLVKSIRLVSPDCIISIDQEGGRVQRLKEGVTLLPPVQSLKGIYEQNRDQGLEAASQLGYLMAAEMRMLDIDLSFAPVLDIDYDRNTVIGNRAFATSIEQVAALSEAYIQGMAGAGMAATGKHFPGHGWANADTHLNDAVDEREFEQLLSEDLLPFIKAIDNGMQAMMFAHVLYPSCDPSPAGYSAFWMQDVLRDKLGFKGIVFSDDLSMKAAHSAGGYAQRAEKSIGAGCQALLCCNDRVGTKEVLSHLEAIRCLPLEGISALKGKEWVVDEARLSLSRDLAKELMDK